MRPGATGGGGGTKQEIPPPSQAAVGEGGHGAHLGGGATIELPGFVALEPFARAETGEGRGNRGKGITLMPEPRDGEPLHGHACFSSPLTGCVKTKGSFF